LKQYGLEAGLTNYASAYSTGLLCARRLLTQYGLADIYKGVEAVNGELYNITEAKEYNDEKRPFKAFLDVGLVRTTTGNRVFGALKGATDGGLYIPHNEKRFPGLIKEKAEVVVSKKGKKVAPAAEEGKGDKTTYNADIHRQHIFGLHV